MSNEKKYDVSITPLSCVSFNEMNDNAYGSNYFHFVIIIAFKN